MTQWQKGCNQVMGPTTHQCILDIILYCPKGNVIAEGKSNEFRNIARKHRNSVAWPKITHSAENSGP